MQICKLEEHLWNWSEKVGYGVQFRPALTLLRRPIDNSLKSLKSSNENQYCESQLGHWMTNAITRKVHYSEIVKSPKLVPNLVKIWDSNPSGGGRHDNRGRFRIPQNPGKGSEGFGGFLVYFIWFISVLFSYLFKSPQQSGQHFLFALSNGWKKREEIILLEPKWSS